MNLNNLFNNSYSDKQYNTAILHGNEDSYPFINYAVQVLKNKLSTYSNQYKYTADRFFNYTEIWDILNNGSLFNDTNFITIEYKTKPTLEHQEQIIKIINHLGSDNFLLIVSDQLTKKDLSSAWVSAITNNGIIINISPTDARTIIKYRLQTENLIISEEAINLLIELNQANQVQLIQELNRLALTHPSGSSIDFKVIQNVDNSQYNIYQLSTAYLSGNLASSIKILDSLYKNHEDAILIMWIMLEDIRKLFKIKSLLKQGNSIASAIPTLRIWGDTIAAIQKANNRLHFNNLISILDKLSYLDMLIKGIAKGDIKYQLIEIITIFAQK